MRHLFAGAVALSLLFAGAASAQNDQPRQDQPGAYQQHQDNRDQRGADQMGDHRDGVDRGHDGYRHDRGRRVCHWSRAYHHRVCRWYH